MSIHGPSKPTSSSPESIVQEIRELTASCKTQQAAHLEAITALLEKFNVESIEELSEYYKSTEVETLAHETHRYSLQAKSSPTIFIASLNQLEHHISSPTNTPPSIDRFGDIVLAFQDVKTQIEKTFEQMNKCKLALEKLELLLSRTPRQRRIQEKEDLLRSGGLEVEGEFDITKLTSPRASTEYIDPDEWDNASDGEQADLDDLDEDSIDPLAQSSTPLLLQFATLTIKDKTKTSTKGSGPENSDIQKEKPTASSLTFNS